MRLGHDLRWTAKPRDQNRYPLIEDDIDHRLHGVGVASDRVALGANSGEENIDGERLVGKRSNRADLIAQFIGGHARAGADAAKTPGSGYTRGQIGPRDPAHTRLEYGKLDP